MTTDRTEAPSSNRPLLWIVAGLLGIVVLTAILLVVRSPASFEPGTPEAVVQDYLQAILDGDDRKAATYFAEDSNCSAEDLRYSQPVRNVRITLVDSEVFADEAEVTVRIRFDEATLGDFSSYDREESYTLVPEDGSWRISAEAWPVYFCEDPS